jgi:hypothetical protein
VLPQELVEFWKTKTTGMFGELSEKAIVKLKVVDGELLMTTRAMAPLASAV